MALLRNDALRNHPRIRRMPQTQQDWTSFIQAMNEQNVNINYQTFTPVWAAGFSSDPPGDLNYANLGTLGLIWTFAQLTGTSDDTGMGFSGIPESITPSSTRSMSCIAVDNGVAVFCRVAIDNTSAAGFFISDVPATSGPVTFISGGFTNLGDKGIVEGTTFLYPL